MTAFFGILRKEWLVLSRRPFLYIQLFIFPMVLVLLVSFAFQNLLGSPKRLPLPVVDLDHSEQSTALMQTLSDTGLLKLSPQSPHPDGFTEDDAIAAFERGRRPAVLVIPEGYGVASTSGGASKLTLFTDPAQPTVANLIATAVQAALDASSFTDLNIQLAAQAGDKPAAAVAGSVHAGVSAFLASPPLRPEIASSERNRGLPSPYEQTVPGFTIWFSATLSSYMYFMLLAERREWAVAPVIAAAPTPAWVHTAAKSSLMYVFGLIQFAVMFALAHFIFGMELGSIPALAAVVAVFMLLPLAVGVVVGALARTLVMGDAIFGVWSNVAPLVGGLLVPVFLLPRWLGDLARISPYYWALDGVQGVIVRGASLPDVWLDVVVLLACAAVLFAAGLPGFGYETRESRR